LNRDRPLDVIIIGAGPAGLTAATYLGRFRRPTLVIDAGESRARWIPESHNTPGFPQGVGGTALLSRLREQALRYGSSLYEGTVNALDKKDGVGFVIRIGAQRFRSRFVMLATGVLDQLPPIEGAAEAISQGFLKICPICDAYEMIDKRIALFGDGAHAAREAEFFAYSTRW
jgi:thioredoxin reductase (NADPH)